MHQPELIRKLLEPAAYPHGVHDMRVIETHISWVILTGEYAYKIKKPVTLGFLDFSSLEQRKFFCEEELRVNRRTAPELYLAIVPIGTKGEKVIVGAEPAIEYAVRMRQFPHKARLDRYLQAGLMGPGEIHALAAMIARFHRSLPPRKNFDPGFEVERAVKPARNNFRHLDPATFNDESLQQLAVIEAWTLQQAATLKPIFEARARDGFIRECHGDLHLENLLMQDGRFVPFDAIEFNHELRWIDTANDIAFLVMDLMARGRKDLAFSLLNAWLEETGDYDSLAVMRFYLVYRSLVRAVVTSIRQQQRSGQENDSFRINAAAYVELAATLVDTPPPILYLMHGFSGSGKSWVSERLISKLPALRVRSDLERKRLEGLSVQQNADGQIESGLYSPGVTDQTYQALARFCEAGLRSGFTMIADATFLRRRRRDLFASIAAANGAQLVILDCATPVPVLRDRIRPRLAENQDASEANLAVLEHQLIHHDPLSESEQALAVTIDSDHGINELIAMVTG
jgi:aminoglycoside phosphotransferase family enzyme/predicted kinase